MYDLCELVPELLDGALGGLAQESLELCEGLFDQIEIGAVRRRILQGSANSFNGFAQEHPDQYGERPCQV